MAKGTEYMLKLLDRLSGPARQAGRALRVLGSEAKVVKQTTTSAESAVSKLGLASARAGSMAAAGASGLRQFAKAAKEAELAALRGGRLNKAGKLIELQGSKFMEGKALPRRTGLKFKTQNGEAAPSLLSARSLQGVVSGLFRFNAAAGEAGQAWGTMADKFAQTPLGGLASGIGTLSGKLFDLGKHAADAAWSAAKLTYGLGAVAAAWLTKEVLEGAAFMEGAALSFERLTGSSVKGAAAFQAAKDAAASLGAGVQDTTQQFIELMAAQFSVGESDRLVKLSADLATVTNKADGAQRAVYAITKIKSTGKLQGDELMMLAEAGLSLDMVYTRLEKRFGKTREQILDMQQAGKIDAVSAIEAIEGAIIDKVHEKNPGEAAAAYAFKTFGGAWKQLQNAPKNFLLRIGERIDTGPLRVGMQKLVAVINKADGQSIVKFVDKMAAGMAKALTALPWFAEGFAVGFAKVGESIGKLADLDWNMIAGEAGKWLGEFFTKSIELAQKLAPVLTTIIDKFVQGFGSGSGLGTLEKIDFGKMAENFGAIAEALGKIAGHALALTGGVATSVQHAAKTNEQVVATGPDFGSSVGAGALLGATTGALAGSVLPGLGTVTGGVAGGVLGAGMGLYDYLLDAALSATAPDDAETTPVVNEPTAALTGAGPKVFNAHITVNGGSDPAEIARLVEKSSRKTFQGIMDRDVSEASV